MASAPTIVPSPVAATAERCSFVEGPVTRYHRTACIWWPSAPLVAPIAGGSPSDTTKTAPAASAVGQVPESVKSERLAALQDLLQRQQRDFNHACIGQVLPVLFEKAGRRSGQLIGRSPYLQSVHAEAPAEMLGRIIPVEISAFGPNSLAGVIRRG